MACFSPLQAYKPDAGGSLVFSEMAGYRPIEIPCGQCIGCRLERSRQWAIRCLHESQLHDVSSFITLTYNDEHLPADHSLHYIDFQLFMKRLRAAFNYALGQRLRFFMCGEYGERRARPHFHACVFGAFFPDRILFKRLESGSNLYTSKALTSLWPFGFSSIGDVTFESAAYVARYVMKKKFGDVADEFSAYRYVDDYGEVHYRAPEFCKMSLKPGIGAGWFEKFHVEVYPRDEVVIGGIRMKPPKYYDTLFKNSGSFIWDDIEFDRYLSSLETREDCTPARLRVREQCAHARLVFKKRTLE